MNDHRPPDYRLRMKDHRGKSSTLGAAWANEKGYINLILNPGVCLNWRDLDGCTLVLFPADGKDRE